MMKYPTHVLFLDDVEADEIDDLFNQLQTIEPPTTLVDSIMTSVAELPPYPLQESSSRFWNGEEIGALVVYHDHVEPS